MTGIPRTNSPKRRTNNMVYRTKYLNAGSVEELAQEMYDFFKIAKTTNPDTLLDNIAYMQEMKVNRLNPQIPVVEFSCIITYTP